MDFMMICSTLVFPIIVTLVTSLIVYIAVMVRTVIINQDKINRLLFGEEPWEGLIKMVIDDQDKIKSLESDKIQLVHILKDYGVKDERLNKLLIDS